MSLGRWRRPTTLPSVFDEMDRMFDRSFRWPLARAFDRDLFEFGPAVDVFETDNELVVKAELPGVKKEDIHLAIEEDRLVLSGESRQEEEVSEEGYHRREMRVGSFRRVIPLPVAVNQDAITARYENGILTVRAPKVEDERKGKRIEIK